jgi:hypothetical protein
MVQVDEVESHDAPKLFVQVDESSTRLGDAAEAFGSTVNAEDSKSSIAIEATMMILPIFIVDIFSLAENASSMVIKSAEV